MGTKVINDIINYAISINKPIGLLASLDYGADSLERLERFYFRFGFQRNKILRDKRFRIPYFIFIPYK